MKSMWNSHTNHQRNGSELHMQFILSIQYLHKVLKLIKYTVILSRILKENWIIIQLIMMILRGIPMTPCHIQKSTHQVRRELWNGACFIMTTFKTRWWYYGCWPEDGLILTVSFSLLKNVYSLNCIVS